MIDDPDEEAGLLTASPSPISGSGACDVPSSPSKRRFIASCDDDKDRLTAELPHVEADVR